MEAIDKAWMHSPVGVLEITASARGIRTVWFVESEPEGQPADMPLLQDCIRQLQEYFAGTRTVFDVPLDAQGTGFQQRVWQELLLLPFGSTQSYGYIAECLGDKNSMRAVGLANGKNPIAIIVPCHRVIGHNGQLTGYAGGLERKRWLLKHEAGLSKVGLFG